MTGYSSGSSINKLGGSLINIALPASAVTVIAAAANVNGLILRQGTIVQTINVGANLQDSLNTILMFLNGIGVAQLTLPLFIPPGRAVVVTGAATSAGSFNLSYDIL